VKKTLFFHSLIVISIFYLEAISQTVFSQTQIRQANYYFDFVNGNNSNNGFTPQTAKKDLNGLNALGSNIAGKTIAFRDSMYYRGSYTLSENNVTLTNWWVGGSDKLPKFTPSTAVTNWTPQGTTNVWQASAGSAAAVWLVFPQHHSFGQDSAFWGLQQSGVSALNREGEYYIYGSTMYIYAPSDPDTYYESVNRSTGSGSAINVIGTGCRLSHIEAFGVDGFVLLVNHGASNTIVEHSSFHHCGSWGDINTSGGGGSGHAIGLRGNGSIVRYSKTWQGSNHGIHVYAYDEDIIDITIEYTDVYNNHHTGIDYNGSSNTVRNATVKYCYIYDTEYSREREYIPENSRQVGVWQQSSGTAQDNIYYYNLLINNGRGNFILNGTGNEIYNNTSINTIPQIAWGTTSFTCGSGSVARNNLRVHAVGGGISAGTQSNNINWIIGGSGTNPQLVSLSAGMGAHEVDAHLQATSPAINYGIPLGYLTDLDGNPINGNPDAGCYEYIEDGSFIRVKEGWNYLSIPKLTTDMSADYLFPSRISPVFKYLNNGYQAVEELENGKGYVVKFSHLQYILIDGTSVSFPIPVQEGWNLIGVFDEYVPVSQITTSPPQILTSSFWGFGIGYELVSILIPGRGYWVRSADDGFINFNSSDTPIGNNQFQGLADESNQEKITFTDSDGYSVNLFATDEILNPQLFELPPFPPADIFDVRFKSGLIKENLNASRLIVIKSEDYPISIRTTGLSITLKYESNGMTITEEISPGDVITISDEKVATVEVIEKSSGSFPMEYKLFPNYPNPFNPSTTINFTIPNTSQVILNVYNVLGELISTLVNGELQAGYHGYKFNASKIASGVYYYSLKAGEFSETKKMLLVK
jgi:hypothetical protein